MDGKEHSLQEIREYLVVYFSLSESDIAERVPSGAHTRFNNRIYWAKSYLINAKLIEDTKRSHFKITGNGRDFFNRYRDNEFIGVNDLKSIDAFALFISGGSSRDTVLEVDSTSDDSMRTPLERLEETYHYIEKQLAVELLEKVKSMSWQFFEDLVVDLMVNMGYGGSKGRVGQCVKRTGDEGIDGIINEDKLGLELIYLQAKHYRTETSIGRPEIQKFVGALHGKKAKKGVFLTTSTFSKQAYEYVSNIEPRVILIDGEMLAGLMIAYDVGTAVVDSYHVKKIDLDYFEK